MRFHLLFSILTESEEIFKGNFVSIFSFLGLLHHVLMGGGEGRRAQTGDGDGAEEGKRHRLIPTERPGLGPVLGDQSGERGPQELG